MIEQSESLSSFNRFETVSSTHPRQGILLKTMLAHPEYATYVRSLCWTLLSWNQDVPIALQSKDNIQDSIKELWNVLKTMRNVETLDLVYLSNHLKTNLSRQCPEKLLSSATSIRLQGMMERYAATSILHSVDPAKLTRLSLDNLYDWGMKGPYYRHDGLWHNGTGSQNEVRSRWIQQRHQHLCMAYSDSSKAAVQL